MRPEKRGDFDRRAILYDIPEATTDEVGQPSQAMTEIGWYWCRSHALRGNEQLNDRQVWPTATHIVEVPWVGILPTSTDNPNGLIMPNMVLKLVLDSSWLHILWADNFDKRQRLWRLTCDEHVGATV